MKMCALHACALSFFASDSSSDGTVDCLKTLSGGVGVREQLLLSITLWHELYVRIYHLDPSPRPVIVLVNPGGSVARAQPSTNPVYSFGHGIDSSDECP